MNTLVFPAPELERLRTTLLSHAPKEAAALVLAGYARGEWGVRLLAHESIIVPVDAYTVQEEYRLQVAPVFLAAVLKKARIGGWAILLVHTHPFADETHFSWVDDQGEALLVPTLFQRAADRPHASLVLGPASFDARTYLSHDSRPSSIDLLVESGPSVTYERRITTRIEVGPEADRSVRAFGEKGQIALGLLTIAIVGLGGMGSIVAEELAHLRVGRLILIDDDSLEVTNLNRVVGATLADVGRPKVDVAADYVSRIQSFTRVVAHNGSALDSSVATSLLSADLIVCCTDTHGSRAVLNQFAYQYLVPVIDLGVRIDVDRSGMATTTGRVQMLAPGLACLACHNILDPDQVRRDLMTEVARRQDPYIVGAREPQPAVISLNGTIASQGVTMLLSAAIGFPSSARHQIYQGASGTIRAISSQSTPKCVICSSEGVLARGDLWPMPWRRH